MRGWRGTVSLASTDDPEYINVPAGVGAAVAVTPGESATGKVYYTLGAQPVGSSSSWILWDEGEVDEATCSVASEKITGLKLEATAGTCGFEVVY